MKIRPVENVASIQDEYLRRIRSYVIGKDPLKVLSKTPARLKTLTKKLKKKELDKNPSEGKWSIRQIIAHLSDTELVLGFRLRMAIAQSGGPLQAMDEKRWADGLTYEKTSVKARVRLFTVLRDDHVSLLKSLNEEQLQRFGIHEERGNETVEWMAQIFAGHDVNHLMQIETIRGLLVGRKKKKKKGKK